jgi:hypothetical protein
MSKTSTEGTVYMLGIVEGHLERHEDALAHLQTCTQLDVEIPWGPREKQGRNTVRMTHIVTLKATDTYKSEYTDHVFSGTKYTLPDGTEGTKSFEEERKSRIHQTERNIASMKSDIAFYKKMIAEYKAA